MKSLEQHTETELDRRIENVRKSLNKGQSQHVQLLSDLLTERARRRASARARPAWYDLLQPSEGETYIVSGKPAVVRWHGPKARLFYEGRDTTLTELWKAGHTTRAWHTRDGRNLFGAGGLYDAAAVALGFPSQFADPGD